MKDTLSKERDEEIAKKSKVEEVLAAGAYEVALSKAKDPKLRKILKHNQSDEVNDHAATLETYLLREEAKERPRAKG